MADTEKDVNRAAAAPQEEASAAQAAPEAPQPETQDAEKTEKKEKHTEGKAHAELAALKTKLEQAEKKLAETKDTLLRTAAEYENFRKRSAREHDAAFDNGVSFAVNTLLPVLDTLEIAADAPTADESYKKGVTMTLDKCREAFGKMGVSEIEAQGKPFELLYSLYAAAMKVGNEHIDISELHEYQDAATLIASYREYGVEAFTFSSGWSSAAGSAWAFLQNGCTLAGMVEINGPHKAFGSDTYEKRPAFLFRVQ